MGKASLVEKRRDWKNTFAKKKEYKGKEGKVERRSGVLQRRLRNARNGIPRSQLRSHPDLTRPYSGLIVIAFCLFARRSFLRAGCAGARARGRASLFSRALLLRFCFYLRKTGLWFQITLPFRFLSRFGPSPCISRSTLVDGWDIEKYATTIVTRHGSWIEQYLQGKTICNLVSWIWIKICFFRSILFCISYVFCILSVMRVPYFSTLNVIQ